MRYFTRVIDDTFLSVAKRYPFEFSFKDISYTDRKNLKEIFYGAIDPRETIEKVYEHFVCLIELRKKLENRHTLRKVAYI
jgi:hypothetical protein